MVALCNPDANTHLPANTRVGLYIRTDASTNARGCCDDGGFHPSGVLVRRGIEAATASRVRCQGWLLRTPWLTQEAATTAAAANAAVAVNAFRAATVVLARAHKPLAEGNAAG